jgi:hypothetical protein
MLNERKVFLHFLHSITKERKEVRKKCSKRKAINFTKKTQEMREEKEKKSRFNFKQLPKIRIKANQPIPSQEFHPNDDNRKKSQKKMSMNFIHIVFSRILEIPIQH